MALFASGFAADLDPDGGSRHLQETPPKFILERQRKTNYRGDPISDWVFGSAMREENA